jgi:hypothetical protein
VVLKHTFMLKKERTSWLWKLSHNYGATFLTNQLTTWLAGFLPWRLGFGCRSDKVALGQVFLYSYSFRLSMSFYRCSIFTHVSCKAWTKYPVSSRRLQRQIRIAATITIGTACSWVIEKLIVADLVTITSISWKAILGDKSVHLEYKSLMYTSILGTRPWYGVLQTDCGSGE